MGAGARIKTPGDLTAWRIRYGMIGLDRYKDWVLEWPAEKEMDPANYPRDFATPASAKTIAAHLDADPFKEELGKNYLVNRRRQTGKRRWSRRSTR